MTFTFTTNNRPARARRAELAVPGSNERMLQRASESNADQVFLDLEDAVAPNMKAKARSMIADALMSLDWGNKTRCVRINDLDSPYAYEDITEIIRLAGKNLDAIMLPKVIAPEQIQFLDRLITMLERKHGLVENAIGIEILIEEIEGLINVEALCKASPRLEAAILGGGDYSAAQGITPKAVTGSSGYPGDIWHYARFKLVAAARAANIQAIDGPFADIRNLELYRDECRTGAILGFDGKWALHPNQIDIAIEEFSPSQQEVEQARKISAAYKEAQSKGVGAVEVDGTMVDVASVRLVSNVLKKAELFGM